MRIFQFLLLVAVIGLVAFNVARIGAQAIARVNTSLEVIAR